MKNMGFCHQHKNLNLGPPEWLPSVLTTDHATLRQLEVITKISDMILKLMLSFQP